MKISQKHLFLGVLIGLGLLFFWISNQPDGRLHLVFCDVGQGDAIYLKFPDGRDALIDGGPNRAVLACLGKHMAFWDRKIELVVLTHPQADHLNGLIDVLQRYQLDLFLAPPVDNEIKGYSKLKELVKDKGIKVRNVYAGDKLKIPNSKFKKDGEGVMANVLWPERQWLAGKIQKEKYLPTGETIVDQLSMYNNVLGAKTQHADLNDFSIILELVYGDFEALLTGDAGGEILEKVVSGDGSCLRTTWGAGPPVASTLLSPCALEIFKVPHHGGVGAVSAGLLERLKPVLAVISVGKNNRYGHPRNKVIEILRNLDIKILRTDLDGEIEVITDGRRWWCKSLYRKDCRGSGVIGK